MAAQRDKHCCILGGCGFLGSVIAKRMLAGGWRVRVFDKENVDASRLGGALGNIELIRGDFMNAGDLRPALADISTVLHFIGTTIPQTSMNDVDYDIHTNVIPTVQLLELMRSMNVPRIVFASSGGTVYGVAPEQRPIRETDPTDPISAYGVSKLMMEKYIQIFATNYGIHHTILRISNPYGEHQSVQRPQGAVGVFLHKALRDEEIIVWGDGSVIRDYLHESDLAEAVHAITEQRSASGIYNIGSGIGRSLRELLDAISANLGRTINVRYASPRSFDVPFNVLDTTKLRSAASWHLRVSLPEGIQMLRQRFEHS
jgi:UDP-glucose 4-epimerase